MWVPDILTIFLIIILVNLVLTFLIFVFWKTQKTYDGFVIWALALLFGSVSYLLFMLRGIGPDIVSVFFANVLAVLAALMRVDAISRLIRSRPMPALVYAILLPFALVFSQVIGASIIDRSIIITLILAPALIATGLIAALFPERETRVLRFLFAASLIIPGIVMIARQVWWMTVPGGYSLLSSDLPNTVFFLSAIICDIMATSSFLLLNMVRSQKEVAESEERYRNLADNLPDYVIIHDGKTIQYANPAACRLTGTAPEELAGRSIHLFLTDAERDTIEDLLKEAPMKPQPFPSREIAIRLPQGQVRQCLVKTVPIHDRGTSAYLSLITDITERKAAEESLALANRKLSILTSITRHDIKNQLLVLKSYLALSKMSVDDKARVEEFIGKETTVANTIERQLDFTKTYEEMGIHAPVWQNVETSIRRAVASLPLGTLAITVDRPDVELFADPMLQKVFYNLVDNALRYGGSSITTLHFSYRESDGKLIIICEDNGAGISPEDKPHLFTQGFGRHTGLGLFLSREILSITGITITETGEPGRGARFEILAPSGVFRYKK